MFDDIIKRINKEDLIKLNKSSMEEMYEEILSENEKDGNPYNISNWYAFDMNKVYNFDEVDQDFSYVIIIEENNELKEWGDYLTEEAVEKYQIIQLKDINQLKKLVKNISNNYKIVFEGQDISSSYPNVMVYEAGENVGIEPGVGDNIKANIGELKDFLFNEIDQDYNYGLKWETEVFVDNDKKQVIFN